MVSTPLFIPIGGKVQGPSQMHFKKEPSGTMLEKNQGEMKTKLSPFLFTSSCVFPLVSRFLLLMGTSLISTSVTTVSSPLVAADIHRGICGRHVSYESTYKH